MEISEFKDLNADMILARALGIHYKYYCNKNLSDPIMYDLREGCRRLFKGYILLTMEKCISLYTKEQTNDFIYFMRCKFEVVVSMIRLHCQDDVVLFESIRDQSFIWFTELMIPALMSGKFVPGDWKPVYFTPSEYMP